MINFIFGDCIANVFAPGIPRDYLYRLPKGFRIQIAVGPYGDNIYSLLPSNKVSQDFRFGHVRLAFTRSCLSSSSVSRHCHSNYLRGFLLLYCLCPFACAQSPIPSCLICFKSNLTLFLRLSVALS